jgi:hypothetical protein
MFELIVAILLIVAMLKIANADNQSPVLWGGVTFLVAAACIALIPLPFIRLGIAGVVVFLAMIGYKAATNS